MTISFNMVHVHWQFRSLHYFFFYRYCWWEIFLIILTERNAHQMKKIPQKYGGSDKQLTITADNDFY